VNEGNRLLRAIEDAPDDADLRLVYADWLDDHDQSDRAELVRACERMRQVPVFSDEYWLLKARRNELRRSCPGDWLAATGYDGSRADRVFRNGLPDDWPGRWRVIREFTERWHGVPMDDVGSGWVQARATEERLGRTLPPSLREYAAFAHVLAASASRLNIDWPFRPIAPVRGKAAFSLDYDSAWATQDAVREEGLGADDPPVWRYSQEPNEPAYLPELGGPLLDRLTDWVLLALLVGMPQGGRFDAHVQAADVGPLREQLAVAMPAHFRHFRGWVFADDGLLVRMFPADSTLTDYGLNALVPEGLPCPPLPDCLRSYASNARSRSGVFADGPPEAP
jgi:uncharacterized protein (TIGR02996 family)